MKKWDKSVRINITKIYAANISTEETRTSIVDVIIPKWMVGKNQRT